MPYREDPFGQVVACHFEDEEPPPGPDPGIPCGSYTFRVEIYGPTGGGDPPEDNIIYPDDDNWWMGNTHRFNGVQWTGVTPLGNTPFYNSEMTIGASAYAYLLGNMIYFPHPEEPEGSEVYEKYHYVSLGDILKYQIDFRWLVTDLNGVNPIPATAEWGIGFSRLWSNPLYVGGGGGNIPPDHPEAADGIHYGQPFATVGTGSAGEGSYVYDFQADDWMRWQNTPIDNSNVNDPNFGGPGVITWHYNFGGGWAGDRFGFEAETLLHSGGPGSFYEWTVTGICRTRPPPPPPPKPTPTRRRIITTW